MGVQIGYKQKIRLAQYVTVSAFLIVLNKVGDKTLCNNISSKEIKNVLQYLLSQANLENYTLDKDEAQCTHKEDNSMAYSRVRVLIGNDTTGAPIHTWVGGTTQDERNDNVVREYYKSGRLWQVIGIDPYKALSQTTGPTREQSPKKDVHLFEDYAWSYYKRYKEPRIAENSKVRETAAINALCKYFSGQSVEEITADDIQDFMNARASSGVSKTTITDNLKTLRYILNSAVEDKIRDDNPAKSSKLSKVGEDTEGIEALPLETITQIIAGIGKIRDKKVQLMVALLALTGVRREEALGLQWDDIDFENKVININRAVTYPRGKLTIKPPKSKAGKRTIPIPDKLITILNNYPRIHSVDGNYLFLNRNNRLLSQRQVDYILRDIRKEIGISNVTAKTFRTTFATMMVATNGVTIKELQRIMGHSKVQTTMDIYAKVEQSLLNVKGNVLTDFVDSLSTK